MTNKNKLIVYLLLSMALSLRWRILYSRSNLDHFDDKVVIF